MVEHCFFSSFSEIRRSDSGKASGGLELASEKQVAGWNWRRKSKWRVGIGVGKASGGGPAMAVTELLWAQGMLPGAPPWP
eukprot:gene6956-biopygen9003